MFCKGIAFLDALETNANLGLDRMRNLLSRLDNPEKDFNSILIGGTNGKGSTTKILAEILRRHGFKVGVYTSPHLVNMEERIMINNKPIPKRDFLDLLTEIEDLTRNMKEKPTLFEVLTLAAFKYFSKKKVDFAVVEVGLGGRLDATNVLEAEISIITNVELDHRDVLGNSIMEIAKEKAEIIKPNAAFVTGEERNEILKLFRKKCLERNSKFFHYGRDFYCKNLKIMKYSLKFDYCGLSKYIRNIYFPSCGIYQTRNIPISIAAAEIIEEKYGFTFNNAVIRDAIARISLEGRSQLITLKVEGKKSRLMLDGAHNPAGMKALAEVLNSKIIDFDKLILVLAFSEKKDIKAMLDVVLPYADIVILTKFNSKAATSQPKDPREVAKYIKDMSPKIEQMSIAKNPIVAVKTAIKRAKENDLILVTGSLYLVGEVLRWIKSR
ncbi:MAG: hypothetical protein DRO65_02205 [Candidatus Altiarchaeales archaeon]|nr:MAG: hypothetical protein DRO65_02205 [Candidatus Altiarchaeales archaeon]